MIITLIVLKPTAIINSKMAIIIVIFDVHVIALHGGWSISLEWTYNLTLALQLLPITHSQALLINLNRNYSDAMGFGALLSSPFSKGSI